MTRFQPLAIAFAVTFAAATVIAPHAADAANGPKARVQGARGGATKPASPKASTQKSASVKPVNTAPGSTKSGRKASVATTTTTTTGTGSTATTTPAPTTAPAPEPNAISTRISRNPQQKARITAMLPAGMTLEDASAGFRNQGQFIAAVNASRSENVPFTSLKAAMVEDGLSLGQAVKAIGTAPPATTTPTDPAAPATGATTGTQQ